MWLSGDSVGGEYCPVDETDLIMVSGFGITK